MTMQSKASSSHSSATNSSGINSKSSEIVAARLVTYSPTNFAARLSNSNRIEHHYVPRPAAVSDQFFQFGTIGFKLIGLLLEYLLIYKCEKWQGPFRSSNVSFLHWQNIDFYLLTMFIVFALSSHRQLFVFRLSINFIALLYAFRFYSWKHFLVLTYPLFCTILIDSRTTNSSPDHWCSENAADLRYETTCLRQEFNRRIRSILFSAFIDTYYICLVPIVYAETNFIRFDSFRLVVFASTIFLSFLMIYTSFYLPLEFLTVLHRNGQHLGSWQFVSTHSGPMISLWDEKNPVAYEPNSIVRHKKQVFRSSSHSLTIAEPGNSSHSRFALLFSRPMVFPLLLFFIQISLFLLQFFSLIFDQRWFVHFSQMIVFIFNTFTIRRISRDVYLLYLVHRQV